MKTTTTATALTSILVVLFIFGCLVLAHGLAGFQGVAGVAVAIIGAGIALMIAILSEDLGIGGGHADSGLD